MKEGRKNSDRYKTRLISKTVRDTAEITGYKRGQPQPVYEISSIKRRFQQSKSRTA